jgi:hypothetical protein
LKNFDQIRKEIERITNIDLGPNPYKQVGMESSTEMIDKIVKDKTAKALQLFYEV